MNNTDKSELRQKLEGLEYNGNPVFEDVPAIDMVIALIQKQCNQARIAGELEELEMAADFAKDVLQQFGYNGKSGGLSTLEWAEGIVKRFEKANTQAKETEES